MPVESGSKKASDDSRQRPTDDSVRGRIRFARGPLRCRV